MDIIVTVPKRIKWSEYELELAFVKQNPDAVMNFRLPNKPNVQKGDKCYIVHDGFIRGYMFVTEISFKPSFTCETTSIVWPDGWFVQRSGQFYLIDPIPMTGFQGFRYYNG